MSAEPQVSTDWAFRGQPAVVLENAKLRLVLLPGVGGKIVSLVDKDADEELIWLNPRLPVRSVPFGSGYDDNFAGGWDELYPTDEPEELAGEQLPDHGELWTLPWSASTGVAEGTAWVEITARTPITSSAVSKRITLGTGASVTSDYRLTNTGRTDQPFLWKSHVAVVLRADTQVDLGATEVLVHEFGAPRGRPTPDTVGWPWLDADGVRHDLRTLPDTSTRGVSEFLIATAMDRGACGVTHPTARTGLQLSWDLADLPSCWLFASYGGGWRGLHTLVLEPCTGYPLSVAEGVAAGTHQVLGAGETRRWRVTATVGPFPGGSTAG